MLTFTASVQTGGNVTYVWDFGDGSAAEAGAAVTHVYAFAGGYLEKVMATDAATEVTATLAVTITEPNQRQ
jgi:hypothetical protein